MFSEFYFVSLRHDGDLIQGGEDSDDVIVCCGHCGHLREVDVEGAGLGRDSNHLTVFGTIHCA